MAVGFGVAVGRATVPRTWWLIADLFDAPEAQRPADNSLGGLYASTR